MRLAAELMKAGVAHQPDEQQGKQQGQVKNDGIAFFHLRAHGHEHDRDIHWGHQQTQRNAEDRNDLQRMQIVPFSVTARDVDVHTQQNTARNHRRCPSPEQAHAQTDRHT